MNIVLARPEDAPALTRIAFAAKAHWGYPDDWLLHWCDVLTLTPKYIAANLTFAAEVDGTFVGFYALILHTRETGTASGNGAELDHLWVAPPQIGSGVGRRLFEHAENTARAAGAVRLEIVSDPHAEGFYSRMGAMKYGAKRASMDGTPRFLPMLVKEL